jgi:O-antigen/teichoic acid export membrane protein
MGKLALSHQTSSGAVWTLLGTVGESLVKLLVLAILARLLSPADFGVTGAALVAVTVFGIIGKFGVSQALVQLPAITRNHLVAGFYLSILMGVFSGLILYLAADFIEHIFRIEGLAEVIKFVAIVLPLKGLQQVSEAVLQRNLKFNLLAAEQIFSFSIGYGLIPVLMAFGGFGIWALVAGIVGQAFFRMIFMVAVAPPPCFGKPQLSQYIELSRFGFGHALSEFGLTGAYQLDNAVVGRMLGADALGIYGRAFQVVSMSTNLLGTGMMKVLFPIMSRVQNEPKRFSRGSLTSVGIVALIGTPLSFMLFLLAPEIVNIMLGQKWGAVIFPFQILSLCIVFRISHRVLEAAARALGAVYLLACLQWLYMLMVLTGAYAGHFYGIDGVSIGVAIAVAINFFVTASFVGSRSKMSAVAISKKMAYHFFLAGTVTIVSSVFRSILLTNGFSGLVAGVGCVAIFIGAYVLIWIKAAMFLGEECVALKEIVDRYIDKGKVFFLR